MIDTHSASSDGIHELLRTVRLSPAQRRIARYIVDHLNDAAFLTSESIAREVGVSQASVSRFAAALGFSGFSEFRRAIQEWTRSQVVGNHTGTNSGTPFADAIRTEIANLQWLDQSIGTGEQILRVGAQVMASPALPVIGLRISASFASHFAYLGGKVHSGLSVIDRFDSQSKEHICAAAESGATWCLAFVLPRYPVEAIDLIEFARQQGLKVAVLSDESFVTVGVDVDELMSIRLGSGLLFDTSASMNVMSSALLHAMADSRPEQSQEGLERFERFAAGTGLFVDL